MAYERLFQGWYRDRQLLYIDFYCRHLTFGDVGCSLSHLQLWEEADRDGLQLLVVFEDDARPDAGAVPFLFHEIEVCVSNLHVKRC